MQYDLTNVALEVNGIYTTMRFTRKLATTDVLNFAFPDGANVSFILAVGKVNGTGYMSKHAAGFDMRFSLWTVPTTTTTTTTTTSPTHQPRRRGYAGRCSCRHRHRRRKLTPPLPQAKTPPPPQANAAATTQHPLTPGRRSCKHYVVSVLCFFCFFWNAARSIQLTMDC